MRALTAATATEGWAIGVSPRAESGGATAPRRTRKELVVESYFYTQCTLSSFQLSFPKMLRPLGLGPRARLGARPGGTRDTRCAARALHKISFLGKLYTLSH